MNQTKFASPVRSRPQEIAQAQKSVENATLFTEALNFFPEIVMILDQNRQMIYCNQTLSQLLGTESAQLSLGKRPGEIFNCIHARLEPAGCGTSDFCRECGAVNAILDAQKGQKASHECRMTVRSPEGKELALDLRVWAIPINLDNIAFTFFVIRDIRDEKRRTALERVFFHDILNDTAILKGYAENARDGLVEQDEDVLGNLYRFTERLSSAILEHRDLLAAEEGNYQLKPKELEIAKVLQELSLFYQKNKLAKNKTIVIQNLSTGTRLSTDPILLWRILGNLVKNALEAATAGDTITLGYREENGKHLFSVHNPAVMTDEVQHQIFQRSFSTKGVGRGLGTYSISLFTKQYLKGKVWFESVSGKGTTFFVALDSVKVESQESARR